MTETKPVEVEIEDIWIWRAERGQQLIRETRQGKPGPGHQDPHGDVIGYIGEQAAFYVLARLGVKVLYAPQYDVPDKGDLFVYVEGEKDPIPLDVKTAGKATSKWVKMPEWQAKKPDTVQRLVGVRLVGERARVFGMTYVSDLRLFVEPWMEPENPWVGCHFTELRPVDWMVSALVAGKATPKWKPELDYEPIQTSGGIVNVRVCPDCGGRPASAAKLFKKANPRRFCGCPYDEAHAT